MSPPTSWNSPGPRRYNRSKSGGPRERRSGRGRPRGPPLSPSSKGPPGTTSPEFELSGSSRRRDTGAFSPIGRDVIGPAFLEGARWFSAHISAKTPPKRTKPVPFFSSRPAASEEPGARRIRRVFAEIFAFFAFAALYLGPPGAPEAVAGLFGKVSSRSTHDKNLASIGPTSAELRPFESVCSGLPSIKTACALRWATRPDQSAPYPAWSA